MSAIWHWLAVNAEVWSVLVTVGVAVLLVCCLECTDCSSREVDDIFKRHEV